MFNTILGRISAGFGILILLLVGILGTTFMVTNQQVDDGLIVNLSGRQRMLTQKLTKETLIYASLARQQDVDSAELEKWKTQISATSKIFETTLLALKEGGAAPLNLDMTKFRKSPPAETPQIKDQLGKVQGLWTPFKASIETVLSSNGTDEAAMAYLVKNNVKLLSEMNKAVTLMQTQAESKVSLMVQVQLVAVAIGLLIVITGIFLTRSKIVQPLSVLSHASEAMSTGDLAQEIPTEGLEEIAVLGHSLDRMRVSLNKLMEEEELVV